MKAYLRIKPNAKCYYCILKWDEAGKKKSKELSTGIQIKGNNKRKAEKKMEEIRKEYEEKIEIQKVVPFQKMFFDEYMEAWLDRAKNVLKPTTYYSYGNVVKNHIIPYFKSKRILLSELVPQHIQSYYDYLLDKGLSAGTIKKHHATANFYLHPNINQKKKAVNVMSGLLKPAV